MSSVSSPGVSRQMFAAISPVCTSARCGREQQVLRREFLAHVFSACIIQFCSPLVSV